MNSYEYQKWALTKDRPTYQDLINRLQLSGQFQKLLHATFGIAGESGEIASAIKEAVFSGTDLDVKNVKEEVGDIFWYIALGLDAIGSSICELSQNLPPFTTRYSRHSTLIYAALGIADMSGSIVDTAKKAIFYGKELNVVKYKEQNKEMLGFLMVLLNCIESSFEEVMQMNHDKLEKRFPGGYTDKLAQERRDKKEGEK